MARAVRPLSRGPPAGRRGPRHASLSGAVSPLHGLARAALPSGLGAARRTCVTDRYGGPRRFPWSLYEIVLHPAA